MRDDDEVQQLFTDVIVHFDEGRSLITPLKAHQILTFGTDSDKFLLGLFQRLGAALDADLELAMQPVSTRQE